MQTPDQTTLIQLWSTNESMQAVILWHDLMALPNDMTAAVLPPPL
jgi:hypothetical protein